LSNDYGVFFDLRYSFFLFDQSVMAARGLSEGDAQDFVGLLLKLHEIKHEVGRASRGRGRHGNEGPGGATAGDDRKMNNEPLEREPMNNEPLEREPIHCVRARLQALYQSSD